MIIMGKFAQEMRNSSPLNPMLSNVSQSQLGRKGDFNLPYFAKVGMRGSLEKAKARPCPLGLDFLFHLKHHNESSLRKLQVLNKLG